MLRILGVLLFQNASPLKLVIPDVPQVTLRVGDSTVDVEHSRNHRNATLIARLHSNLLHSIL